MNDFMTRQNQPIGINSLINAFFPAEDAGLYRLDRPGVAWDWMRQTGQAPASVDWVRPQVAEAWLRCIDDHGLITGVDFVPRNNPTTTCPRDFEIWLHGWSGALATLLSAMIYNIRTFLDESSATLVLSDPLGRLIYLLDAGLNICPGGVHMTRIGADWGEANLGNNGIGTASALGAPAAFNGKEHFSRAFHPYATAGCPIQGPDGSIAAIVGIITDQRAATKLMLGFLKIACRLLESNLFEHFFSQGLMLRVSNGDTAENIAVQACLIEGRMFLSDDERILGANQSVLDLIGVASHAEIIGETISSFMKIDLAELLRLGGGVITQSNFGRPLRVEIHRKSQRKIDPSPLARSLAASEKSTAMSRSAKPTIDWTDSIFEAALQRASGLQERKIPLLITGESGVGKDLLVRRLHATGPRKDKPLVAINCAAIPRELIESELFGYEGGSFTGARAKGKRGKFVEADKGILFLDEIGDMALDLQATLLRVLDSSEVVPIGGSRPIQVDVLVVAATNCGLQEMVQKGAFRRDLYYRLNGVQLWLPPLRERPDRLRLIAHLMRQEQESLGVVEEKEFSEEVWRLFLKHPWPGNIREVRNVLRSLIAVATNRVINVEDLPRDFLEELNLDPHARRDTTAAESSAPSSAANDPSPIKEAPLGLADWEAQAVRSALVSSEGNVTKAARCLGITRATLYHKMVRYGLRSDKRIICER